VSSDNRLVAAQSGWVGSSSAALHAKTAKWLETSRRLLTSVGDHATDLNQDGAHFSAMEREHAELLRALNGPTGGGDGSARV
jgi:uncharacterized protein YukE